MNIIRASAITLALLASASLTAAEVLHDAGQPSEAAAWEHMASYEPCMNGEVSASGLYPSQIAEDKSFATLGWIADAG